MACQHMYTVNENTYIVLSWQSFMAVYMIPVYIFIVSYKTRDIVKCIMIGCSYRFLHPVKIDHEHPANIAKGEDDVELVVTSV